MIKKQITYVNFNGEKVTEDFYFHFTQAECMKMELGTVGGFSKKMFGLLGKNASNYNDGQDPDIDKNNVPEIVQMFEDIILNAYGIRTANGGFIKPKEAKEEFKYSEAYSVLFMELINNPDEANKFISGVFPEVSSEQKAALEQK